MNPQLKVPIQNRRRRKRIVTLKNFGYVVFVALLVFVVITIRSEMRGPQGGDYGRLYRRQVDAPVVVKQPEIVTEAQPVPEAAADPFSLDAAKREQFLTAHVEPVTPTESATVPPLAANQQTEHGRIRIVGDGQTVTVEKTDGLNAPVLGGGFTRP